MAVRRTMESGSDLVRYWGELSDAALLSAVIMGIVIVFALVVYIIFNYKKSRMVQDAKEQRSRAFVESNDKVGEKLDRLAGSIVRSNNEVLKSINSSLGNVNETLSDLKSIMKTSNNYSLDLKSAISYSTDKIDSLSIMINNLLAKINGTMSSKDTVFLIKIYFLKIIFNDVEKTVHKSLEENDFINRRKYVTNKVRTNIGSILSHYRSDLSEYELPFSINRFFKIDSNSTSERFMLVDLVWVSIEEIFTSKIGLKEKKEEASLRILNVINDYVTEILSSEEDDDGTYSKAVSNH